MTYMILRMVDCVYIDIYKCKEAGDGSFRQVVGKQGISSFDDSCREDRGPKIEIPWDCTILAWDTPVFISRPASPFCDNSVFMSVAVRQIFLHTIAEC